MVAERRDGAEQSPELSLYDKIYAEIDMSPNPLEVIREAFSAHNLPFSRSMTLIADGNGRWAEKNGVSVTEGHTAGADATKRMLKNLSDFPEIEMITVWALSPDNLLKRSPEEIGGIMELITQNIKSTIKEVEERKGRIVHLGEKEGLPDDLVEALTDAEARTSHNKGQTIVLAINYNGRQEYFRAVRRIVREAIEDPTINVTDEYLMSMLDELGLGESDLVFRTGGEQRTSGFGWRIDYAEEITVENFLPDLNERDLAHVLLTYAFRNRRFGGRPGKAIIENIA